MDLLNNPDLKLEKTQGKRAAAKERSRRALIDAALEVVAEFGVSGASVARIRVKAGLSQGMINMHFDNKENLLLEAAHFMADQYYAELFRHMERAGDAPEQKLKAMIDADLSEAVLNRKSIALLFAFRGEARSGSAFIQYSDTRDRKLNDLYISACLPLLGGDRRRNREAMDIAHGVIALLEGMWSDYFLHSDHFDREAAKRVIFRFLAAIFPNQPLFAALIRK